MAAFLLPGCAQVRHEDFTSTISVRQIEELRDLEILLPLLPDSIVGIYRAYDAGAFYREHGARVSRVVLLMDSLNSCIPAACRFDSLCLDHAFENIGQAGRMFRTLAISSSYFILFPDDKVLRSVVFHEYGHSLFESLGPEARREAALIWEKLARASLLYLFSDSDYSHNARFGGHPYDEPSEMFASAFNLFHNNIEQLDARMLYVEDEYTSLVRSLFVLLHEAVTH